LYRAVLVECGGEEQDSVVNQGCLGVQTAELEVHGISSLKKYDFPNKMSTK
jgi:hypothetical protein